MVSVFACDDASTCAPVVVSSVINTLTDGRICIIPGQASNGFQSKSTQPKGLETQTRISVLEAENQSPKQQLDWFKRQLFGRKSEKRLVEHPDQLGLAELLSDASPPKPAPTEEIKHTRRKGANNAVTTVSPTLACASMTGYPSR